MEYIRVNKNSTVPLFIQIRDAIIIAINSSLLKPGDQLPTEAEICDRFNISRPVVRQAYQELINRNLI